MVIQGSGFGGLDILNSREKFWFDVCVREEFSMQPMWKDRRMVNFVVVVGANGWMCDGACFRSRRIIFCRWYQTVLRYQTRITWKVLGSAAAAAMDLVWASAYGPQSMHVYILCMCACADGVYLLCANHVIQSSPIFIWLWVYSFLCHLVLSLSSFRISLSFFTIPQIGFYSFFYVGARHRLRLNV